MRVVPNLYPALERQEVVVHGPEHLHSLAELPDTTLALVAEAWQRRACDAGGICFPFVNEGLEAGASLPHSHSQLAWLPAPPPAVAAETGLPATEEVGRRDGLIAGCPVASRVAYEILIHPERPETRWGTSGVLGPALALVGSLLRRLHEIRGGFVPINAWLHDGDHGTGTSWHLEVFPRTTRLAGLELGAGVYIDPVAPEVAATELRSGL